MEGKTQSLMTSAAAFVEGGIQESCDDACSICLEEFCKSDPSTVTTCKHEFHLQCILEWCQRSSQCPMCWQPISLKDPTSQELFEAVEQERSLRVTPSRNAAIFHYPVFGDFELQHLRMSVNGADFEEQIIQHLAAAAAMGRAHQLGRREGQQTRSAVQGHPHFLVFSAQPIARSSSINVTGGENESTAMPNGSASTPVTSNGDEPSQHILHLQAQSSSASGSAVVAANRQGICSTDRGSTAYSSPPANQGRAGPSELHSFSDSLRSRLNAASMRYKESISKGARGWKERLFSRSSSISELHSENRREVNAGIAGVSRLMESLETSANNSAMGTSLSNHLEDSSMERVSNQNKVEAAGENSSHDNNTPAACSANSRSN